MNRLRFLFSLTSVGLVGFLQIAEAHYVYSGNRCDHSLPIYRKPGVCGDRRLPEGRNRNAHNIRLLCSSESDHHIRGPLKMDVETAKVWQKLEKQSRVSDPDRRAKALKAMHDLRIAEPKIEWSGVIPYQTVEKWTWTECSLGQSMFHCGTHIDQVEVPVQVLDHVDKDGISHYRTEMRTEDVTTSNYCDYDSDVTESLACSHEEMDFHVEFLKPGSDWRPPADSQDALREQSVPLHLRYNALIPNKYDLLPGEFEDIQAFSNASFSDEIQPALQVGDAWNHYETKASIRQVGGPVAACQFGKRYHTDFTIETKGRDNTRITPNAFRIADQAFKFFQAFHEGKMVDIRPSHLLLEDVSHGVLEVMSGQIRASSAAIEAAKRAHGLGSTGGDATPEEAEESGMYKNTQLRIKLLEINRFLGADILARDRRRTENYLGGGEGTVKQILTVDGDNWKVPLDESYSQLYRGTGPGITKGWFNSVSVQLKPNTSYLYLLSMYQEGIPFYAQKGQEGNGWSEFWNGEDAYFSRPLEIPFQSPDFDERGFLNKLADY